MKPLYLTTLALAAGRFPVVPWKRGVQMQTRQRYGGYTRSRRVYGDESARKNNTAMEPSRNGNAARTEKG
jgi:hypothetical protein